MGSVIGGVSIFFLFIPLNTISLFLLKIIVSIVMVLVSFGERNFLKTYLYFYTLSIFLGGVMYFLNYTLSYKNEGLVFFSNGLSINFIVMFILSPILLYAYIKEKKEKNQNQSNYYLVDIYIQDKKYRLTGYLDTGNTLKDPYKKRPVIITNDKRFQPLIDQAILVPYETIGNKGIIKCIKPDKVVIENKEFSNCLIGKSNEKFRLEDSDCILPNKFKEELL